MADNRMYMRCKHCGQVLFLGKRLGFGYYWMNYGREINKVRKGKPWFKPVDERPLEDQMNDFFSQHEWCNGEYDLDCFEIVYESDPDFGEKVVFEAKEESDYDEYGEVEK